MDDRKEFKDKCRERLKKIIGTKILTTMVYPLSQFETAFGEFWGINKEESELTEQEKEMRIRWAQVRENILNNGNTQKRNMFAELDLHDVVWLRYNTTFIVRKGKE